MVGQPWFYCITNSVISNLYKLRAFRHRTPCESFHRPLLEIEGNEKLKSLTSEVSLILRVPNCSGQPGNGMLIGRLFVQLFKGFSAILRYLWRGRPKRLFAVGKERTFHLSVGMSPSFSTSPKIMNQGDDCVFNSLGGRFMFQVRTSIRNSERVRPGGKTFISSPYFVSNQSASTTSRLGPFRYNCYSVTPLCYLAYSVHIYNNTDLKP